jgi:hypothetical protein
MGIITGVDRHPRLKGLFTVSIRVTSAIVPEARALKACRAVAESSPLDQWLPRLRDEGDADRPDHNDRAPFRAWIVDREARLGLDEYDSFASRTAAERPTP